MTFLNTNHKVATINAKTPKPKTIISFLINVIMSSAIIGMPPKNIFPTLLYVAIVSPSFKYSTTIHARKIFFQATREDRLFLNEF